MKKTKKAYPYDFATSFGAATMGLQNVAASALMTVMFMQYLTDYAGLGAWGAGLATTVLLIGRIIDAVNDPLQGYIMDNAKVTKVGKYRRFTMYSIFITLIALILLYNLPIAFTKSPVLVTIWVLVFYLAYDFGTSFFAQMPLIQSVSHDVGLRAKLTGVGRIVTMIIAIAMNFFMASALAMNGIFNNLHKSIGVAAIAWLVPISALALIGVLCFKEGKHEQATKDAVKVKFKDIVNMFKTNKALLVQIGGNLFFGLMWTLIFATNAYYLKWAFCADLTTGAIDTAKLGGLTAIVGMLQIFPIMIAAGISPMITRKLGSAISAKRLAIVVSSAPGIILFILQIMGVLQNAFPVFIILVAIQVFGAGLSFVPDATLLMESCDYNQYMHGHEMSGQVNAVSKFMEKFQSAISTILVGAVLVAIGYSVDATTGNYLGDLTRMPSMLNSFMFIAGLVPTLLGICSFIIFRKYPITDEIREAMRAKREAAGK